MKIHGQNRKLILIFSLLTALLAPPLSGCRGPLVLLPGGALQGEKAEAPANWSFTNEIEVIQLETNPSEPYSVNLWVIGLGQDLYVHAGTSRAQWIENMEANPRVRLQVNDSIYELVASRVVTQDEFDRFMVAYVEKYGNYPRNRVIGEVYLYRLAFPDSAS